MKKTITFIKIHRFLWYISLPLFLIFISALFFFAYLPRKWIIIISIINLLLLTISGYLAFQKKRKLLSFFAIFFHLLLILLCLFSSLSLPTIHKKIRSIFKSGTQNVSLHENVEKPFTIFVAGNDQWGELKTSGRYDVNMLITINFKTHDLLITSIPRDSYLPNPAYAYGRDKLTHMGISGIQNSMLTLTNTFNTPINNYLIVNFTTFRKIVDALGGITFNNPYAFPSSLNRKYSYEEGEITLNGDAALFYCRERFNLPQGDFDRNAHQVIILKAILKKLILPSSLLKIDKLLEAMKDSFLTNVPGNQIENLIRYELEKMPKWNIMHYHIRGTTGPNACSSHDGEILSVVYPFEKDIDFIGKEIAKIRQDIVVQQKVLPSQE